MKFLRILVANFVKALEIKEESHRFGGFACFGCGGGIYSVFQTSPYGPAHIIRRYLVAYPARFRTPATTVEPHFLVRFKPTGHNI